MKTPRGISALGTFLFFVVFLVALGVLWVATGGPSRAISHSSPFLKPPTSPGVATNGTVTGGGTFEADTDFNSGNSANGNPPSLLDQFFNFNGGGSSNSAANSPYSSDVRLSAESATSDNPDTEYILITTSEDLTKPITITGWSLESKIKAIKAPIGSASQVPISGQINNLSPITLGAGARVYITTGRSPNGDSFRTNMCTGYLQQFQNYSPSLETDCPNPQDEALRNPQKTSGTTDCIDFINQLSACQIYTDEIPASVGGSCQNFIQNDLTYNGCVSLHRNDPSFYRNDWRVFLNRQQELWQNNHDQIRLLDENGNLIASVTY